MSRFTTARDVFEAFPSVRDDIEVEPSDEAPLVFLKALAQSGTPENAVAFCAYLLPRREAVWWACQCVRALNASRGEAEDAALQAAEAWVQEPEEDARRLALQLGSDGNQGAPATWLAYAAAWSGGSMRTEEPPVPAPPYLTAKAVRAAVLMALARVPVTQRRASLSTCLNEGMRLASGDAAQAKR
jgi:hypothetical protein